MAKFKEQAKSLIQQKIRLQQLYPSLIDSLYIQKGVLTCIIRLQPTQHSIEYKVLVKFRIGYWPSARILEPKEIAQINGHKPHHLYNRYENGKERLCVFYTKGHEWNDNMFIAEAYIPWIITWLSAYEIWQIAGVWVYPEAPHGDIKD